MRTRRRRLLRTRAAARLPGSLKFGVTIDASANPCDGQIGFTRRAPRHRAGAVFPAMRRVGPRVLFIDDIILYRDDARQPLCLGFGQLSSRRPARMKIIAFSQRVLRAPGSGRAWTRDRPPPGSRTLLVSYRSFRSSIRLMRSVYAAAKILRYRVFLSKNPLKPAKKRASEHARATAYQFGSF